MKENILRVTFVVLLSIVGYATYDIADSVFNPVVADKPVLTNTVAKVTAVQTVVTNKPLPVVAPKKVSPVVKPKKFLMVAADFDLPGIDGNRLIDWLETAENPDGDPDMVGDTNLRHHAYGTLQIRQPYLTDVIRFAKKDMIKKYGRVLTIKDMKDRQKARWVARVYLHCYGKEYTRRTGKIPTYKIYAKIHNGGPEGWHPRNLDTKRYWAMVVRVNGLEGTV